MSIPDCAPEPSRRPWSLIPLDYELLSIDYLFSNFPGLPRHETVGAAGSTRKLEHVYVWSCELDCTPEPVETPRLISQKFVTTHP